MVRLEVRGAVGWSIWCIKRLTGGGTAGVRTIPVSVVIWVMVKYSLV